MVALNRLMPLSLQAMETSFTKVASWFGGRASTHSHSYYRAVAPLESPVEDSEVFWDIWCGRLFHKTILLGHTSPWPKYLDMAMMLGPEKILVVHVSGCLIFPGNS